MHTKRQPNIFQLIWRQTKRIAKREYKALFLGLAVLAGSMTFFAITKSSWARVTVNWWLLALVAAVLALPEVYQKLANYGGPYIVWFASAFREGFLCVVMWPDGAAKWQQKLGQFWVWVKRMK